MKSRAALVIVIIFLLALVAGAKSKTSTKAVEVEIELEEIQNTEIYEIEVKKTSAKKEMLQSFSQQDSYFKIKLKVGNYLLRTRIITRQAEVGPWSEWSVLLAKPEAVNLSKMASYNIAVDKNKTLANVDLKWEQASGADQYVIWVEDLVNKKVVQKKSAVNNARLDLKTGEYKIGVQSISKDGIRSDIKYFDNSFYVAYKKLPQIKLERLNFQHFKWIKQNESEVKIEIYRKAFFADKYVKIETIKERGEYWILPKSLPPGEYKIEFQYVSEAFESGPVQLISYLKKPDEIDFSGIELQIKKQIEK